MHPEAFAGSYSGAGRADDLDPRSCGAKSEDRLGGVGRGGREKSLEGRGRSAAGNVSAAQIKRISQPIHPADQRLAAKGQRGDSSGFDQVGASAVEGKVV